MNIYYFNYGSCIQRNSCELTSIRDYGSDGDCHYEAKWLDKTPEDLRVLLTQNYADHEVTISRQDWSDDNQNYYQVEVASCPCLERKDIHLVRFEGIEEGDIPRSILYVSVERNSLAPPLSHLLALAGSNQVLKFLSIAKRKGFQAQVLT